MQHKREAEAERRLVARIKHECAGGDSKGGGQQVAAVTPPPPPPDITDASSVAQNKADDVRRRAGAGATMLTGTNGAADPTVATPSLGGGTKTLLG